MLRVFQERAEQTISGFKSPADDYLKGRLNIADHIIIDPHNTFYFQMDSNAMRNYGIRSGDLLIVDRSVTAVNDAIVIGIVEGVFYCRCYAVEGSRVFLKGDEGDTKFTNDNVLEVWGVVTAICRGTLPAELRKGRYKRVCTL